MSRSGLPVLQAKIKPAHLASSSTHAAAHTCTYRGLPTHKPKPNLLTLQAAAHMQQHTHTHTHTHTHASTHKHAHTEIYHTSQNQACQPCIQHHTCSSTHAHTNAHTYTHTDTHSRTHTIIHTHMHKHTQHTFTYTYRHKDTHGTLTPLTIALHQAPCYDEGTSRDHIPSVPVFCAQNHAFNMVS